MGKSEKVRFKLRLGRTWTKVINWSGKVLIFPFWDLLKSSFNFFIICRRDQVPYIPQALSMVIVSSFAFVAVMYLGFVMEIKFSDE